MARAGATITSASHPTAIHRVHPLSLSYDAITIARHGMAFLTAELRAASSPEEAAAAGAGLSALRGKLSFYQASEANRRRRPAASQESRDRRLARRRAQGLRRSSGARAGPGHCSQDREVHEAIPPATRRLPASRSQRRPPRSRLAAYVLMMPPGQLAAGGLAPHQCDLRQVNRLGLAWMPRMQVHTPEPSIEGLDHVLPLGRGREERKSDGERYGRTVVYPVRSDRRVYRRLCRASADRRPIPAAASRSAHGSRPSTVHLVSTVQLAGETPKLTVLNPLTCISRLCSMSKCAGVTELGDDTKMNPTRLRMSPGGLIIPRSSPSRVEFIKSAYAGSSSMLSSVSHAFAWSRLRMTSPGRDSAPRGGPP